jgi:DNA invertase Pin-like site-specific DNA recombinase
MSAPAHSCGEAEVCRVCPLFDTSARKLPDRNRPTLAMRRDKDNDNWMGLQSFEPKRFVSYLRVSTSRQGMSGLGIDAQRETVDRYVQSVGGKRVAELVEIESGGRNARPILVQSIALCRKERAILLIAKLDRLARNVAFVSSLMESGIEFVAADAHYANKLMIHILAAFAEHERELISIRTKSALQAAKARGVRLGENGKRLAEQHKAAALQFSFGMESSVQQAISEGACTLTEIASVLNKMGRPTREGAEWSPGTVHRLLHRLNIDHK